MRFEPSDADAWVLPILQGRWMLTLGAWLERVLGKLYPAVRQCIHCKPLKPPLYLHQ